MSRHIEDSSFSDTEECICGLCNLCIDKDNEPYCSKCYSPMHQLCSVKVGDGKVCFTCIKTIETCGICQKYIVNKCKCEKCGLESHDTCKNIFEASIIRKWFCATCFPTGKKYDNVKITWKPHTLFKRDSPSWIPTIVTYWDLLAHCDVDVSNIPNDSDMTPYFEHPLTGKNFTLNIPGYYITGAVSDLEKEMEKISKPFFKKLLIAQYTMYISALTGSGIKYLGDVIISSEELSEFRKTIEPLLEKYCLSKLNETKTLEA